MVEAVAASLSPSGVLPALIRITSTPLSRWVYIESKLEDIVRNSNVTINAPVLEGVDGAIAALTILKENYTLFESNLERSRASATASVPASGSGGASAFAAMGTGIAQALSFK